MKTRMTKSVAALGVLLLIFGFYMFGCELSDIREELPTQAEVKGENASISTSQKVNILFKNVLTSSTHQPANVTITVSDPIGKVTLAAGAPVGTSVVTTNGVVSFALERGTSLPYSFQLKLEAQGFLPKFHSVLITERNPLNETIYLVPLKENVPGVTRAENNSTAISNGKAIRDISFTTKIGNSTERLTIRIPANTAFLDANGNQIPGQELRIVATHYATSSPQAMLAAPAPFVTPNISQNGRPIASLDQPGIFSSLGMATVDMWVDGTEVKSFSTPIEFEFELDEQGTTGLRGQRLAPGGSVAFWSFDESEFGWEGEGTSSSFTRNGAGKLVARVSVIHLSTYNLDYKGTRCPGTVGFNLNVPANGANTYTLKAVGPNGQPVSPFATKTINVTPGTSNPIDLQNVPADIIPVTIQIIDANGVVVGTTTITGCNALGDITVPGQCPSGQTRYKVELRCITPGNIPAGIGLFARINGGALISLGNTDLNGDLLTCEITSGDSVVFELFGNNSFTIQHTIGGPPSSASGVTVTSSGNKITITYGC